MDTERLQKMHDDWLSAQCGCEVDSVDLMHLIAAMIADGPTPRLPQQDPRYVAGFTAGAEWARETDAALTADTYGGDPDDDPVDLTLTTNPDGTRTPRDEPATGIYTCSPDELVEAMRKTEVILTCDEYLPEAAALVRAVRELSWWICAVESAKNRERLVSAYALARAVQDMS